MDWQIPLVILIVAAAVAYLGWQTWRSWANKKSGCGGCSCSKLPADGKATLIPSEQLTVRRRGA